MRSRSERTTNVQFFINLTVLDTPTMAGMMSICSYFGLAIKNVNWVTLGYFLCMIGAITSENSGNPGLSSIGGDLALSGFRDSNDRRVILPKCFTVFTRCYWE